ncbi:MAG TPA: translational GTPase TypA [Patescibacteria group bacterium]|nr:translational GTPase TypA [Patescibacteria group bacterium]
MELRNIAIIAHVDHGKTTLVDGLLKQSNTFRDNEAEMSQDLIMDSNDQERERGITILAKNTAVHYKDVKINIIDTPGHADFGGEVERTLNMADGAILLIDAQEGPMPQTKFVLKKALEIGLKLIVVINKIDKRDVQVANTLNKTYDLFLDLATHESQLDFPVYFCISREGKAWDELPQDCQEAADLTPIFKAILKYIPAPDTDSNKPFQMQVTNLDWDNFQGKYAVGRITNGKTEEKLAVSIVNSEGVLGTARIEKIYVNQGLKKVEVKKAEAGNIVAITGIPNANIGDTIADSKNPIALPPIKIEEPTLKMAISANTSPFAGLEGEFVTSRQILERIKKELQTNISLKLEENGTEFILSGRGELHLSVFIETLRREGFELQVKKPQVITKGIDGTISEPVEELTIDVDCDKIGVVKAEVGKRKGILLSHDQNSDGTTRLVYEITTRGLLGLRNQLLRITRGTATLNSIFLRFQPAGAELPKLRNGVLIASAGGKAVAYGINIAQGRGMTIIEPNAQVYAGQIIGLNNRGEDLEINVTKEKQKTNIRSSTSDIAVILTPPTLLSLEQCLDFLENDEFLEVTPKNLRLRKIILDAVSRAKAKKVNSN